VVTAALKVLLCAAQLKLATVGFTQVGLTDAQASFYSEHFAVQLGAADDSVRVSTPKDMADLLGVEKQKQLLGCSETASSCMAELAGALGADGLITGQVAKVGKSYQVNVKVLAADGSKTLYLHSSKLLGTEEELIEELNTIAPNTIARVRAALGQGPAVAPVPVEAVSDGRRRSKLKLIPAALGLGVLVLGGAVLNSAKEKHNELTFEGGWSTLDPGKAMSLRDDGKNLLAIGTTLAVVGFVAMVGGLLWFLLS
jgi:hypothetical protein